MFSTESCILKSRVHKLRSVLPLSSVNVSFQEMKILSRSCALILVFILMQQCTAASLVQGPEPVSVLAPVGSFVEFNCTINSSELPANTFFDTIRWWINDAILIRMNQVVTGNTVTLEVAMSYISAAASVQCSIQLNGTIEVSSDMTATLTAYGIVSCSFYLTIVILYRSS